MHRPYLEKNRNAASAGEPIKCGRGCELSIPREEKEHCMCCVAQRQLSVEVGLVVAVRIG